MMLSLKERTREKERRILLLLSLATCMLDIERKRKKIDSLTRREISAAIVHKFLLWNPLCLDRISFCIVECTDRMLSIVICLLVLLLQQFSSTEQFQTIQVTLASSVELPCSTINQTSESINPAKVNLSSSFDLFFSSVVRVDRLDSWWSCGYR